MGNHRFRLSDMMPNAWFYKLKDINRPNTRNHPAPNTNTNTAKRSNPIPSPRQTEKQVGGDLIPSRASHYFPSNSPLHPKASDTLFPLDSPRKSSRKPRKKPASSRLISSNCTCRNSLSESESNDIVFELPPILTKPAANKEDKTAQVEGEQEIKKPPRKEEIKKSVQGIHRLRVRAASPRLVSKKVRVVQRSNRRKGLSESFAVVKHSSDPKKDFRDSMMEMIRVHELRAAKDLEELLACFLSLNSEEYHDVIVKVFEEIWFDVTDIIRL